jgi:hypothetical protein
MSSLNNLNGTSAIGGMVLIENKGILKICS